MVTTLSVLVASPLIGVLTEKFGVRPVTLVSTVGFGLCFFLFAFNNGSLLLFYATYALLSVVGAGTLPITWTRAVITWFRERRGLALGLSLLMTGRVRVAGKALRQLDGRAFRLAHGLCRARRLFRCSSLSLLPLPIATSGARPVGDALPVRTPGGRADAAAGARHAAILDHRRWPLIVITLGVGGIIPNLEPLLATKGIDRDTAVDLAAIIGLAVLVGRPTGGWLIDRFWAPGVAFVILAAPALAFLVMSQAGLGTPALAACVFLIGFASGVEYDVVAYLVSRYFGMRSYSAIYGCLYVAFALGAGFGPKLIADSNARQHGYDGALIVTLPSCWSWALRCC